jgi:soluble lytic murein transglycosylase
LSRGKKSMYTMYTRYKYIIYFFLAVLAIALLINNSTTILRRIFPLKYGEYVFRYSEVNNIDPYLVFAIIKAESSFNPNAKSAKNARGLMQIMDETAIWGAENTKIESFKPEDLYDPETNIKIGCWFIRQLYNEFSDNMDLVIAAYNGGSGNVKEWLSNKAYSKHGASLDIIPFKETERFLKKVKGYYYVYSKLYKRSRKI